MAPLEVLKELLLYLSEQIGSAEQNKSFAELHHCIKIASHYKVAKTCYEDVKRTLLFLAEEHNLEQLPGDK